jgi:membrane-bound lytic murein transglycosylase B
VRETTGKIARSPRRGAGAVERAGLENRNTRKRIVGSNPTLSANRKMNLSSLHLILFLGAHALLPILAPPAAAQQSLQPEIEAFIDEMAQKHNFARDALRRMFSRVEPRPDIIRAVSAPLTARPWYEFRVRYVTARRIAEGVTFWEQHAAAITLASHKYGVPEEIIVSTIGIESLYGRHTGSHKVLDALTMLAFYYPPRARLFRSELEEFLLLAREAKLDTANVKGSYAGAIGIPQFLPSSYRRYAIDFDGDGRRDLVGTPADAIGSVANYYRKFGWREDEPVAVAVNLSGGEADAPVTGGLKPRIKVAEFRKRGVVPLTTVDDELMAQLFAVALENGQEYWLGFNNFYVITRYNPSVNYALAVLELARELRAAARRDG